MVVLMLNNVPCLKEKKSISQVFFPREPVIRRVLESKKDWWVLFVSYVEASVDTVVTNYISQCTHACIALGLLGNL